MRLHDQLGLVIEINRNVLKSQNSHFTGKNRNYEKY
jgi:hypothetical protein